MLPRCASRALGDFSVDGTKPDLLLAVVVGWRQVISKQETEIVLRKITRLYFARISIGVIDDGKPRSKVHRLLGVRRVSNNLEKAIAMDPLGLNTLKVHLTKFLTEIAGGSVWDLTAKHPLTADQKETSPQSIISAVQKGNILKEFDDTIDGLVWDVGQTAIPANVFAQFVYLLGKELSKAGNLDEAGIRILATKLINGIIAKAGKASKSSSLKKISCRALPRFNAW